MTLLYRLTLFALLALRMRKQPGVASPAEVELTKRDLRRFAEAMADRETTDD